MGGAVPPLSQYAFMAWCSVRGSTGHLYFTFTESSNIYALWLKVYNDLLIVIIGRTIIL